MDKVSIHRYTTIISLKTKCVEFILDLRLLKGGSSTSTNTRTILTFQSQNDRFMKINVCYEYKISDAVVHLVAKLRLSSRRDEISPKVVICYIVFLALIADLAIMD